MYITNSLCNIFAVALRNLTKSTSSDKVRKTAAGALWVLENKDQQEIQSECDKLGLYDLMNL